MKLNKWEWLIIAGILVVFFGIAYAVDEKLTISYTPITLTASKYLNAQSALLYVEGNDIRVTMDGVTTPTSGGVGIKLIKDTLYSARLLGSAQDIKNFKAVRASNTDATINVVYQWPTRIP